MSNGDIKYCRQLTPDGYAAIECEGFHEDNIVVIKDSNSTRFNSYGYDFYEDYKDVVEWTDVTLQIVNNNTVTDYRDTYIKIGTLNNVFAYQLCENEPFTNSLQILVESFALVTDSMPVFSFIEEGNQRCIAVEKDGKKCMLYSTDDGSGGLMQNNIIIFSSYACDYIQFEVGALPVVDYSSAYCDVFFDSCNYDQDQSEYLNTKAVMTFSLWGRHYRCEFDYDGSNPNYNDLVITLD